MHTLVLEPQEFLDIANQIYVDKDYQSEPGRRTVISRAYYASFLATFRKMQTLGQSFTDTDRIHRDLIERVKDKNPDMAYHLDTLREKRVEADYLLTARIAGVGECKNWLKLAETILIEATELK